MEAQLLPQEPTALGKYEVLCRLSTGGMSEIFLAYQRGIGGFRKIVALKTILPDTRGHEETIHMFLNEARVTAEFCHPNIVQVYDLGIDNDMLFLAMEYVQGCNVIEMVRACHAAQQTIPMGFSLAIVRDTALALSYAHGFVDMRHRKRPIVHRDVAGKNIMVTFEGTTKLLDFGIAKMQGASSRTFAGTVKGTTGYMSPEQLLGKPLDGRSDIFSLGIVIHECLTGYRLFHETSPEKKKTAVLNNEIQLPSSLNPNIPTALDEVIMKALEREPDKRFQSALEFARALEDAAGEHMWRAEQVGALVLQHFSKRREQTRELIEKVQTRLNEFTGQIHIEDLLNGNPCESPMPNESSPSPKEMEKLISPPFSQEGENSRGEIPPPPEGEAEGEGEAKREGEAETAPTPPLSSRRSSLIPLQLPLPPGEEGVALFVSPTEKTDSQEIGFFSRLMDGKPLALSGIGVLLGFFLALLLFWIFSGFG